MAKEPRREQSPHELRAEIAQSRDRLAANLRAFRREIDFPAKIRRSFRRQTVAWITAAVVVGALVILLPARRKTVYVDAKKPKNGKGSQNKLLEAGFALGALKFAVTVLKPVLASYLTKKMRGYTEGPRPKSRGW